MPLEFFATRTCPYCAQLREELDCDGLDYVEYDIDADPAARERLKKLAGPSAMVPILVEAGRVTQIGIGGRGCYVGFG